MTSKIIRTLLVCAFALLLLYTGAEFLLRLADIFGSSTEAEADDAVILGFFDKSLPRTVFFAVGVIAASLFRYRCKGSLQKPLFSCAVTVLTVKLAVRAAGDMLSFGTVILGISEDSESYLLRMIPPTVSIAALALDMTLSLVFLCLGTVLLPSLNALDNKLSGGEAPAGD